MQYKWSCSDRSSHRGSGTVVAIGEADKALHTDKEEEEEEEKRPRWMPAQICYNIG